MGVFSFQIKNRTLQEIIVIHVMKLLSKFEVARFYKLKCILLRERIFKDNVSSHRR